MLVGGAGSGLRRVADNSGSVASRLRSTGSWDIPNRSGIGFRGLLPINAHGTSDRPKNRRSSRDADFPLVISPELLDQRIRPMYESTIRMGFEQWYVASRQPLGDCDFGLWKPVQAFAIGGVA